MQKDATIAATPFHFGDFVNEKLCSFFDFNNIMPTIGHSRTHFHLQDIGTHISFQILSMLFREALSSA